jgi:hypothetical protein
MGWVFRRQFCTEYLSGQQRSVGIPEGHSLRPNQRFHLRVADRRFVAATAAIIVGFTLDTLACLYLANHTSDSVLRQYVDVEILISVLCAILFPALFRQRDRSREEGHGEPQPDRDGGLKTGTPQPVVLWTGSLAILVSTWGLWGYLASQLPLAKLDLVYWLNAPVVIVMIWLGYHHFRPRGPTDNRLEEPRQ